MRKYLVHCMPSQKTLLEEEEKRERFYMLVQSSFHLKDFEKTKFYADQFEKFANDKNRVSQVFFKLQQMIMNNKSSSMHNNILKKF